VKTINGLKTRPPNSYSISHSSAALTGFHTVINSSQRSTLANYG
jgi:hypothetical protein